MYLAFLMARVVYFRHGVDFSSRPGSECLRRIREDRTELERNSRCCRLCDALFGANDFLRRRIRAIRAARSLGATSPRSDSRSSLVSNLPSHPHLPVHHGAGTQGYRSCYRDPSRCSSIGPSEAIGPILQVRQFLSTDRESRANSITERNMQR